MKVCQVLTTTILPLLLAGTAHAATTVFTSTAPNAAWDVATNWSAGVPGEAPSLNLDALLSTAGSTAIFTGTASNPSLNSVIIDATGAGAAVVHNSGQLTTQTLIIGDTKKGSYTQKGGQVTVTGNTATSHLIIGAGAGGNGSYTLESGTLTSKFIHVGGGTTQPAAASSGTFLQTGGTVNVTGSATEGVLIVGDTSGTSGNYTISGGALTANQLYIGLQGTNPTVGDRSFIQTGGTVTINDSLTLGGYDQGPSTPTGTYTLSGANSVLNTSKVWVGLSGSGTFTQESGTHNINLGTGVGDHSLLIAANQAGSTGVYNMKGGTLTTDAIYVGFFDGTATGGSGTLNHTGGTINVGQRLTVDNGKTPGSLGTYTMSGTAVLNTTTASAEPGLYVAGKFQQQGGTVNANSTGTGAGLRIDGTYENSGGTLQGSGTKINYGTYSGFGTIAGGKFVNEGAATFSGGVNTINAPVENGVGRTLEIGDNVATFNASVSNSGEFKTSGATAVFNGAFTNLSDSYLNAITAGDLFRIGGSLSMQGGDASLWSTETAVLEFFKGTGNTDGNHSLLYAGLDLGMAKNATGFLGYQDNFSWGEVIIRAGNQLLTSGGGALYTEKLTFDTTDLAQIQAQIATFTGNLKIYYDPADNPQLQGRKFDFGSGGGSVAPVPEPSALLILGVGAIGLGVRRRRRA